MAEKGQLPVSLEDAIERQRALAGDLVMQKAPADPLEQAARVRNYLIYLYSQSPKEYPQFREAAALLRHPGTKNRGSPEFDDEGFLYRMGAMEKAGVSSRPHTLARMIIGALAKSEIRAAIRGSAPDEQRVKSLVKRLAKKYKCHREEYISSRMLHQRLTLSVDAAIAKQQSVSASISANIVFPNRQSSGK